jgi:hypothetical protein
MDLSPLEAGIKIFLHTKDSGLNHFNRGGSLRGNQDNHYKF